MTAPNVLIFEADKNFADELREAFAQAGCETRVVEDGQAGLDVAVAERPDLIVLAIELPKMNGFAVCNRLKKHADLKDVPLIIISSDAPQETFDQHSKLVRGGASSLGAEGDRRGRASTRRNPVIA